MMMSELSGPVYADNKPYELQIVSPNINFVDTNTPEEEDPDDPDEFDAIIGEIPYPKETETENVSPEIVYEVKEEVLDLDEIKPELLSEDGIKHNITIYCDACKAIFYDVPTVKVHMTKRHYYGNYTCSGVICATCGFIPADFSVHKRLAHDQSKPTRIYGVGADYSCSDCAYSSNVLINMRQHVDMKHGGGNSSFICEKETCNGVFKEFLKC